MSGGTLPDAAAAFHRGYALSRDGRYAEAVAHYERSLALEPSSWTAEENLGIALNGAQLAVAVYFFRVSWKFIRSVSSALVRDARGKLAASQEGSAARLRGMARWLFTSAVGMVVMVGVMPYAAFSGFLIFGIYRPVGWGGEGFVFFFSHNDR